MTRGRGWHGESERHRLAAIRGIKTKKGLFQASHHSAPTVKNSGTRNIAVVKMALKKMRTTIRWLNPLWDSRGSTWQMDVRQQTKLTKELDDVWMTLETIELPAEMTEKIGEARENITKAWTAKEQESRVLYLEIAREILHNEIITYLDDRNEYHLGDD